MQAKNAALAEAGAVVPDSFEAFEGAIKKTYEKLVEEGTIKPQPDVPAPSIPMDLEAAKKAGKVRHSPASQSSMKIALSPGKEYLKQPIVPMWHEFYHKQVQDHIVKLSLLQVRVPTNIVSSICDDRGEEPTYNGVTMSTLITGDYNVGDVISLLWFKRQLPKYATRFIEMVCTSTLEFSTFLTLHSSRCAAANVTLN